MKQFSILLLILISAQTIHTHNITRTVRLAHSSNKLQIPPKPTCIPKNKTYKIHEQDAATQTRIAIMTELERYKNVLDEIRYELIEAYRNDKYVSMAEEKALQISKIETKFHHERLRELYRQLAEIEKMQPSHK